MTRKAIVPDQVKDYYHDWKMAPAHQVGELLFFTGMTGSLPDGSLDPDPEIQIRNAFEKIGWVLAEAGLGWGNLVEMTSYHVGLKSHFDIFRSVRSDYMVEPYPAWTAIEVQGFVRVGAIVEIRVIAQAPPTPSTS